MITTTGLGHNLKSTDLIKEMEKFLKLMNETPEAGVRPLLEDISWAILSSKEFQFNH